MNKRDQRIMEWVRKNRPDMVELFEEHFRNRHRLDISKAVDVWVAIAFEAGREFERENPGREEEGANIYL